jgi:hypothetical protein
MVHQRHPLLSTQHSPCSGRYKQCYSAGSNSHKLRCPTSYLSSPHPTPGHIAFNVQSMPNHSFLPTHPTSSIQTPLVHPNIPHDSIAAHNIPRRAPPPALHYRHRSYTGAVNVAPTNELGPPKRSKSRFPSAGRLRCASYRSHRNITIFTVYSRL